MLRELFDLDLSSVMLTCTLVYFTVVFLLLIIPNISNDTVFCQKGLVHVHDYCQNRNNPECANLQMCSKCSMLKTPSSACCCMKRHLFYEHDDDNRSVISRCSNRPPSGKYSASDLCSCDSCEITKALKHRSSSGDVVRF